VRLEGCTAQAAQRVRAAQLQAKKRLLEIFAYFLNTFHGFKKWWIRTKVTTAGLAHYSAAIPDRDLAFPVDPGGELFSRRQLKPGIFSMWYNIHIQDNNQNKITKWRM
jgi:hypothetical protein